MRRRITRDIDTKRSRQHAIHPGVRSQDGPPGLEPLTQRRLQVTGDRDHERGGLERCQVIDQRELLFWSQRGLQDDHLVAVPGAGAGLRRAERLDRDSEPSGRRPEALREQEFVLDQEEFSGHGCRIAPDRELPAFLLSPKALGACYNRARESWVEG